MTSWASKMRRTRTLFPTSRAVGSRVGCAAMLLAVAAGCGEKKSDAVSVSGRVSYQNKPMTSSALTFFPASGRPIAATVLSNGTYSSELPPGEYRVTIDVGRNFPPGWKEGDPEPPPPIALPAKYSSRLNTPLKATVTAESDSQTIEFALP